MSRIGSSARNAWTVTDGVVDLTRRQRPPLPVEISARPQPIVLDLARTACVVVDMQNDFCAPGGWLDHLGVDVSPLQRAVAPIEMLLGDLRSVDVPVIWLNWGNRPDRANLPPGVLHVYDPDGTSIGIGDRLPGGSRVLEKDSWSAEIIAELTVEPADIRIDKFRMSGFFDTELASTLANLDVSTLLFCGVNLDQCVFATLMDAACLGFDCVLLEDCVATTSPPACVEATLYNVAQCFGFVSSGEVLAAQIKARVEVESFELLGVKSLVGAPERHASLELRGVDELEAHHISAGDRVKLALVQGPNHEGDASVFFEVWEPKAAQPDNSHPASVETFFFLSGEGVAHCDGVEQKVQAGQFLVLPPGSLHRIENTGAGRLYAITTMTPDCGFASLVTRGPATDLDAEDLAIFAVSR